VCGIVGFFSTHPQSEAFFNTSLRKMTDTLSHRGPDDAGYWIDPQAKLALGHRRLSIIDLSPTGHQPMESSQGHLVTIFNGEIYNYLELKKELDAQTQWRGSCDTEVLLRGFEVWGIQKTLEKTCGMFALAVYDKRTQKLTLARDRLGEKPLYYGWIKDIFVFGSELKILKGITDTLPEIDPEALAQFFRYGYIPGPRSIFKGIKKLPPGTFLEMDLSASTPQDPQPYWEVKSFFLSPQSVSSFQEASNELENIFLHVMSQTSLSDVPIGTFLSGGIDSSFVTALMHKIHGSALKTFTIGFDDTEFDEAIYAKKVAQHLGTDHHEHYMTSEDVLNIVPKLPTIYDEPFADSSQIPTLLLSTFTRSKVKVALSGDGADELFAGYTRYTHYKRILALKRLLPTWTNQSLSHLLVALTKGQTNRFSDLIRKGTRLLTTPESQFYENMISLWKTEESLVKNEPPLTPLARLHSLNNTQDITSLMYTDLMTYLPDDILVKVDRASMSQGLETRAPFLDRRIVEFACQLPLEMKYDGKTTKKILRNILYKYIPKDLIERPKQGFGVPLHTWLRGPLKEWAQDLLSPDKLARHGYLNEELIHKKWNLHLSQQQNCHYSLWAVLMFQSWYDTYKR